MLQRALAIDPGYPPAYASLVDLENRRGNTAEAARYAQILRRTQGSPATAAASDLDRARMEAEQLYLAKSYDEAAQRFAALRDRYASAGDQASVVSMTNNLGLCDYKLGRHDAARTRFQEVIALDPGYVRGYTNLGLVEEATGHRAEAMAAYEAALRVEPANRKAMAALSRLRGTAP
jgi:Tfp pilus assembly protein PilF